MERVPNPMVESVPAATPVSKQTIHMAGLLVDVYGLAELAPTARRVSCLWLHHPRLSTKENMADIATRCINAWNSRGSSSSSSSSAEQKETRETEDSPAQRGLIALAFDQRNHNSRSAHPPGNAAWNGGNPAHAQDMFGIVAGTVSDQIGLLDAVGGYLFLDEYQDAERERTIDQHLALGVSLGGHSVWQLMFADPRVRAGVCVIGCPDYMSLLTDRARLTKLPSYSAADEGASFLGSRDFPRALIAAVRKTDPKALLFGTSAVPPPPEPPSQPLLGEELLQRVLEDRLAGKKFLVCSGGEDKLVPYRCSKPFLDWLKGAVAAWFPGTTAGGLYVEDNVYEGAGHAFTEEMVKDAVRFIADAVAAAGKAGGGVGVTTAKI